VPFTFFAHQAAVLPAKLARPHRVSGTALVFGSMAPDFEYFLRGYPMGNFGHTLAGQVLFCLPLTLLAYWLVTRVIARPLAAHLPDVGDFHLRDYAALAAQPRARAYWLVVAASALAGSATHVVWDSFTHEHSPVVQATGVLRVALFYLGGVPITGHRLLQHGSTLVGGVATLVMLHHVGRERLLARWAAERGAARPVAPPPDAPPLGRTVGFWMALALFPAAGAVASVLFMREGWLWTQIGAWVSTFLRMCTFTFAGLCVVCAIDARRHRRSAAR
jgi:hypothetical protein